MIFSALFISTHLTLSLVSPQISCEPSAETADRLAFAIYEDRRNDFRRLLECADEQGFDIVNIIGAHEEEAAYPLCAALSVKSNYYFTELLERGADVDLQSMNSYYTNQTPLLCAVSSEFDSATRIRMLLELGANSTTKFTSKMSTTG